ncbi:MAG: hypothetical protein J6Y20_13720 [Lachnospiraceae bacterium]|nr:hypothetical protein [Lachnospiraceae bacterium]
MKKRLLGIVWLLLIAALVLVGCESDDDDDDDDRRGSNTVTEAAENKDEPTKAAEPTKAPTKPVLNIDVSSAAKMEYSGFNGMGVANCSIDYETLYSLQREVSAKLTEQQGSNAKDSEENYDLDVAGSVDVSRLFSSISFLATPEQDLSNGDTITVKVLYNESEAAKLGLAIEKPEFTQIVSGLKVLKSIDAFDGFTVHFSGSEEKAQIILDNSGCSDFVRNYVLFDYDRNQTVYRNGEKFTVKACWGDNLRNGDDVYVLASETKEFTIDGLNMYPTKLEGLDIQPIVKNAWDEISGAISEYLYVTIPGNGWSDYAFNGRKMDGDSVEVSNYNIRCEKVFFMEPKENRDVHSKIILIFHLQYDVSGEYGFSKYSAHVDTYHAGMCSEFELDSQGNIVSKGNTSFVLKGWGDDALNDRDYVTAYNRYIEPFNKDYLVNEIPVSPYDSSDSSGKTDDKLYIGESLLNNVDYLSEAQKADAARLIALISERVDAVAEAHGVPKKASLMDQTKEDSVYVEVTFKDDSTETYVVTFDKETEKKFVKCFTLTEFNGKTEEKPADSEAGD